MQKPCCAICQGVWDKHPKLFPTILGDLCYPCYYQKHMEFSQKGFEEKLRRDAQKRLEAENQAFNDFIETGIVTRK